MHFKCTTSLAQNVWVTLCRCDKTHPLNVKSTSLHLYCTRIIILTLPSQTIIGSNATPRRCSPGFLFFERSRSVVVVKSSLTYSSPFSIRFLMESTFQNAFSLRTLFPATSSGVVELLSTASVWTSEEKQNCNRVLGTLPCTYCKES